MTQVTFEVPDEALRLIGKNPAGFAREVFETAVVQWFAEGRLSQGQAAEMLGLRRGEFFEVLYRHRVSPIQITREELKEEFA